MAETRPRLQMYLSIELDNFIKNECKRLLITRTELVTEILMKEYKKNKNGLELDCESWKIL